MSTWDWSKKELAKHIMLDLFENGLLNEFDASSVEALQEETQELIYERLKELIIVTGKIMD